MKTQRDETPLRILHLVYHLDVGGIEKWLFASACAMAARGHRVEFVVFGAGAMEDEFRAAGFVIHRCERVLGPSGFFGLFKFLRTQGPFDVIHTHVAYAGLPLWMAKRVGIRRRVAHSHSDERQFTEIKGWLRRFVVGATRRLIPSSMTHGVAFSRKSARGMFGDQWENDDRVHIVPCGIRVADTSSTTQLTKSDFGLSDATQCVVTVGRLHHGKNIERVIDIAAAVRQAEQQIAFLVVGDGPMAEELASEVEARQLRDIVKLLYNRDDVHAILRDVADLFLLPSHYEGLGIAVVEAQAQGVPCLVSEAIPSEAIPVPALVRTLSTKEPVEVWVKVLREHLKLSVGLTADGCRRACVDAGFDVSRGAMALLNFYRN